MSSRTCRTLCATSRRKSSTVGGRAVSRAASAGTSSRPRRSPRRGGPQAGEVAMVHRRGDPPQPVVGPCQELRPRRSSPAEGDRSGPEGPRSYRRSCRLVPSTGGGPPYPPLIILRRGPIRGQGHDTGSGKVRSTSNPMVIDPAADGKDGGRRISGGLEDHRHAVPGPEGEHRPGLTPAPRASRKRKRSGHHGDRPGPSPSWRIPGRCTGAGRPGRETRRTAAGRRTDAGGNGRVEDLGVGPDTGMAVGHVGTQDDRRPRRDVRAADLVVRDRVAQHRVDRRIVRRDASITRRVYPNRGRSSAVGVRPPRTSATSARSRRPASGCRRAGTWSMPAPTAVVSCPAPMNVMIWSRSSTSVSPSPVSSSRTGGAWRAGRRRRVRARARPAMIVGDQVVEGPQSPSGSQVPRRRHAGRDASR